MLWSSFDLVSSGRTHRLFKKKREKRKIAMEIVVSISAKIGEYLVAPIARQFGYLVSFSSNIENLREQVEKLDEKRDDVQLLVDAARRNVETIRQDVEGWLNRVDEIKRDASTIFEEKDEIQKGSLNGCCPNLKSRYLLSRKAKKKTHDVLKLQDDSKFDRVSNPAHPIGIISSSTGGYRGFGSRISTTKEVMEALKNEQINMIGICGMGGVGKTTMVKEVAKIAQDEKLFDEIVIAVVSQNPNLEKIQDEIADTLGVKFEEKSLHGRASKLRERLMNSKRIFVILDDVWSRLDLEAIGIPFGDDHKGCKIVLTSRNEGVCDDMGTKKNIPIGILLEEEAWNLFKDIAGISIGTAGPNSVERLVAKECQGLPLAIVTLGSALKNRNKRTWEDALQQLKKSIAVNIRGVQVKVFSHLELSYNYLESEEAKPCFLICSLFPEDSNIPIEDLVRYGMGLELFKGTSTVEEARNRVHAMVEELKRCYLLLDGTSKQEQCVKMHDVVRDVAISIASRDEHGFMVKCDEALKEWPKKDSSRHYAISLRCSSEMHGFPDHLNYPKLQLLKLECDRCLHKIPDDFFVGMKELKVLALSGMLVATLPVSVRCLTNLRTLSLSNCELRDVSIIGELRNLQILRIKRSIEVLPKEVGQLASLKLLDWSGGKFLPSVLSGLSKLEELYTGRVMREEGKEPSNASVATLMPWSHLTTLDVSMTSFRYLPNDIPFGNLKKFNIRIGGYKNEWRRVNEWDRVKNQLALANGDDLSVFVDSGITVLLNRTETLELYTKGLMNVLYDLDN
ncbi:hypothetical protein F0562_015757 [Nyssa sinensis]|uniref:AAA+ ATPase domain-containing protein n=1 Tax=Nyssa sinensis TaxID=561372 RepID=A0A5J4ZI95_9ASTE|nr:hypothetical protein F0562_015757 [Nyssa sinensis]